MNGSLNIKHTVMATLILGTVILAVFIYFQPKTAVYMGGALGLLLAVVNFVLMVRILEKLLKPEAKKAILVFWLVLKIMFLIGVVVLAFWVWQVDVLAFSIGYLCLVVVLTIQGLLGSAMTPVDSK